MPIYEFLCGCGHEFEDLVPRGTAPPCPECGREPRRKFSPFSIGGNTAAQRQSPPAEGPSPPLPSKNGRAVLHNVTLGGPPGGKATGIRAGDADMTNVSMSGLAKGLDVERGGDVRMDRVDIEASQAGIENKGRVSGRRVRIKKESR